MSRPGPEVCPVCNKLIPDHGRCPHCENRSAFLDKLTDAVMFKGSSIPFDRVGMPYPVIPEPDVVDNVTADLAKASMTLVLRPLVITDAVYQAVRALDALTEEQRAAVFRLYCPVCGRQQPWHYAKKGIDGIGDHCDCSTYEEDLED